MVFCTSPESFNYFHIGWRILYLAVFAWLLFIDLTTNFRKFPSLRYEGEIVHVSHVVIAFIYFDRFIFQ